MSALLRDTLLRAQIPRFCELECQFGALTLEQAHLSRTQSGYLLRRASC